VNARQLDHATGAISINNHRRDEPVHARFACVKPPRTGSDSRPGRWRPGLVSDRHLAQNRSMSGFDDVWARIERHAGQTFTTATGLPFTYRVPGDYVKVIRDGREINRSLSRTNFLKASAAMPAAKPSDIKESQGSAYTWAILMDRRIRGAAW
jgi:hypothetical protein